MFEFEYWIISKGEKARFVLRSTSRVRLEYSGSTALHLYSGVRESCSHPLDYFSNMFRKTNNVSLNVKCFCLFSFDFSTSKPLREEYVKLSKIQTNLMNKFPAKLNSSNNPLFLCQFYFHISLLKFFFLVMRNKFSSQIIKTVSSSSVNQSSHEYSSNTYWTT